MSTSTTSPLGPVPPVPSAAPAAPIPLSRLVRVELRKAYDTRAGFWLLVTIAVLVVLAEGALFLVGVYGSGVDIDWGAFIGVAAFVTSVFLPVLGIMLVTGEWSQRTAMVTFALEPRRARVVAAKAVVGLVLTVVTAFVAVVLGSLFNGFYAVTTGHGDWTFGWNYFGGFLIVQGLAMLSGFALATLLLNTPAALVAFFAYSYVLPTLLFVASNTISGFADVRPWIDFSAAQQPLGDLSIAGREWAQLVTSGALWLGLPLALGVRRILRAEVK